jgi:hypothetical protein
LPGCGDHEPTYSLKATAKCFRANGYKVWTQPIDEPPATRRAFSVVTARRTVADLYFDRSPAAAKAREREAAFSPILTPEGKELHHERHANVTVVWVPDAPGFGPTGSDRAVLKRCLS